jgi:tetratricopeptide (TPR) repeat protein
MIFISLLQLSDKYNILFTDKNLEYKDEILAIYNGQFNINELDLNNPIIIRSLIGYYSYILNNFEEALKYSLSCQLDDDDEIFLGLLYYKLKNYDEMIKIYEIGMSKNNWMAYLNMAEYYRKDKLDINKAEELLLKSFSIYEHSSQLLALSLIYHQKGLFNAMLERINYMFEMNKNNVNPTHIIESHILLILYNLNDIKNIEEALRISVLLENSIFINNDKTLFAKVLYMVIKLH